MIPEYEYIMFGLMLGIVLTLDGVFIVRLIKNRNRRQKDISHYYQKGNLPLVYRNAPQRRKDG